MEMIPIDIIKYISFYLDINSLNNLRCVCKKYNKILYDKKIYKHVRDTNLIYEKNISIKLIDDNGNINKEKTVIYYCLKCGQIETDKKELIFKCMHCDNLYCKKDLYSRGIINIYGFYMNNLSTNCYLTCKSCLKVSYLDKLYDYVYKKNDKIYITPQDYNRLSDENEKNDWISVLLLN